MSHDRSAKGGSKSRVALKLRQIRQTLRSLDKIQFIQYLCLESAVWTSHILLTPLRLRRISTKTTTSMHMGRSVMSKPIVNLACLVEAQKLSLHAAVPPCDFDMAKNDMGEVLMEERLSSKKSMLLECFGTHLAPVMVIVHTRNCYRLKNCGARFDALEFLETSKTKINPNMTLCLPWPALSSTNENKNEY
jgi:hypothetical protein